MCRHYTMLNLHPALPNGPTGTWTEVIWSLIQSSASETGAMVHIAVEILDRGPVVSYFTIPIRGPRFDEEWDETKGKTMTELRANPGEELPLFKHIRNEGYLRESHLLAATLRALSTGGVVIKTDRVFDSAGIPIQGLSLSSDIETRLNRC